MSIIQKNISLMPYNTFHLDVKAKYLVDPEDVMQVKKFLASPESRIRPRFVLGGGSNILFAGDFDGIIVRPVIRGISKIKEDDNSVWLRAGAGESWDSFVAWCVDSDFGGIENLSLIPGSVGASPIQNIGAYGVEVRESVYSVESIVWENGKTLILEGKDCHFGYRDSIFKHELRDQVIITHVIFKLDKKHRLKTGYSDLAKELVKFPEVTIRTVREAVINIRKNKLPDPEDIGNAGSFFKNPIMPAKSISVLREKYPAMPVYPVDDIHLKLSAAWLIEQCGLKGKKSGNTGSYEKQPLILVNHGGATGHEILNFAREIQKSVTDHFGITLEMEVNVIGGGDEVRKNPFKRSSDP